MLRQLVNHRSKRCASRQLLRRLQSSVSKTTTEQEHVVVRDMPRRALSSFQLTEFDAMKGLMDTLQVALVSPRQHFSPAPPMRTQHEQQQQRYPTVIPYIALPHQDNVVNNVAAKATIVVDQEEERSDALLETQSLEQEVTTSDDQTIVHHQKRQEDRQKIMNNIQNSMNANDVMDAYEGIETASNNGVEFSQKFLYNSFRFMLTRNPIYAYDILCKYREQYTVDVDMNERLCLSVATLMSSHAPSLKTKQAISQLRRECQQLPREEQERVLPILLESMVTTSLSSVRAQSNLLYSYLCRNDFEMSPEFLERLLAQSKYWCDNDLPYHHVLQRLADTEVTPKNPTAVVTTLANFYPFTDTDQTLEALQAIHLIVHRDNTALRVDMGTLEQILAAAARKGKYELGLLAWDLAETLGYEPTESLFESMIQAFCMSYRQDHRVFSCLAEMEDYGFVPSRALLRSISRSLRFSIKRVDNAYRFITTRVSGCRPSLNSLNAIMSACAENGDVDRTFSVLFDDFKRNNIDLNEESFSFAMEALAVSSRTDDIADEKVSRLEAAEELLNMMEARDIKINHNVFHEYVRVLLNYGQLEMATAATLDAYETKGFEVENKTIVLLVNAHGGDDGNYEKARELAGRTTEPFDFLATRIDRWERGEEQDDAMDEEVFNHSAARDTAKKPSEEELVEGAASWRTAANR